jgi:hypothetical protein
MCRILILLVACLAITEARRVIDPRFAKNITVFHVNEKNYSAAPIDMNTADLRGDMYFDLRTRALNLECGPWYNESFWSHLDCDNAEVATPVKDLIITKLLLEVDSRYGSYADCNIGAEGSQGDNNGTYSCACHSHEQADCSVLNSTACGDYHHGTGYGCRWNNESVHPGCYLWTCSNSTTPDDCENNYGHPVDCGWDTTSKKCVITSTPAPSPKPFGGTCNVSVVGMEDLKSVDWGQHDVGNNLTEISAWHDNVMNKVGGLWFSTQRSGYCDDPDGPKTGGCSWRVAKVIKRIPKNCSDSAIDSAVVNYDMASKNGRRCFSQCSASDRANTSSVCYTRCFYATVLGPQANHR